MQKKYLVIDDEVDITEILALVLQDEGHHVSTVNSGNDAIALLEKHSYDIIISDFNMPNGNGMKVLEYAKSLQNIPFFFFLSTASESVETECLKKGATRFFRKPIPMGSMFLEIEKIITANLN